MSDAAAKDEIRKAWESADGRVVVGIDAFGLGIDGQMFVWWFT